jgi:hypothetical protein
MDHDQEHERLREAMENAKALYESAKIEFEHAKQLRSDSDLRTRTEAYGARLKSRPTPSVPTATPLCSSISTFWIARYRAAAGRTQQHRFSALPVFQSWARTVLESNL